MKRNLANKDPAFPVMAMDIMPRMNGRKLYLEISRLKPGTTVVVSYRFVDLNDFATKGIYALLSLSDTSVGMSETTVGRILNLFITTKKVGQRTRLGLDAKGLIMTVYTADTILKEEIVGKGMRIQTNGDA